MTEHTPTPWFHRQAGEEGPGDQKYDWIADSPERGKHRKIIVCRESCDPADYAFIVKAVNNHDALVKALELLEKAEEFHANCEECNGEDIPELCEKCFPHYDNARVARRLALHSLVGGMGRE